MNELEILKGLVSTGMSLAGACAMAGNMQAESGFVENIAQRGMTKLTDAEYTAAADIGTIDFANDSVGYGLCQWTYRTRKAALLAFAREKGVSVGNGKMQLEFCAAELKRDYGSLWEYLTKTESIYDAAAKICTQYERPAVNNIEIRARYAQELYDSYAFSIVPDASPAVSPQTVTDGRSAEAYYLAARLYKLGYDVLWEGLHLCIGDFQRKTGLEVSGVCGEETWKKLAEVQG